MATKKYGKLDRRRFLMFSGAGMASLLVGNLSGRARGIAMAQTTKPAGGPAKATAAATGRKIVIRLGAVTNPSYAPQYDAYEYFGKKLVEATGGEVEWKSYPSSQLGSNRDITEGVKMGSLEMTPGGSELGQWVPLWDVVALPYLFDSYEQTWKVMDGEVGKIVEEHIENAGFKLIGFWAGETRSVYTTKRPVYKPEDLKGLKIRVQPNRMHIAAFNALGAIATPIGFNEVYTALQQGVLDGGEQGPLAFMDMKFYEVAKYYSLTKHLVEGVGCPFLMGKKFFDGLPADIRKLVVEIGKEATLFQRKIITEKMDQWLASLKGKGITVAEVDTEPFAKIVRERVFSTIEGKGKQDLIARILQAKG
jgi:tripartite ATP-independent transporter DctP family solute receptor